VAGLTPGDAVIGINDRLDVSLATQAEYAVLDADHVTAAPTTADAAQAATVPLNGLTAWQALDAVSGAAGDQTLLVTGAAGAVGGYAVELAAARGARVIATGRPDDRDLLARLGATHVLDRDGDLAAAVRTVVPGGVDAVVDAAGIGSTALAAARGGADFAVLVPGTAPTPLRGSRVHEIYIRADRDQLATLARLVDASRLTLRVAGTYPLDKLAEAHRRLASGGLRGRLVVTP
jgi:NADPH:quinone reductase